MWWSVNLCYGWSPVSCSGYASASIKVCLSRGAEIFSGSTTLISASFYGSSHISLPFQEAKSSTDVHFRFRTFLPNALILLVAGTTDYCIVRLENGRIKININLGAGESELLSPHNLRLSDFKWHEVSIIRREANLSMQVDKAPVVQ